MWYFEYPVEIDNKGIRIKDPDHITEFYILATGHALADKFKP